MLFVLSQLGNYVILLQRGTPIWHLLKLTENHSERRNETPIELLTTKVLGSVPKECLTLTLPGPL